jgi:hypothetical protein
MNKPLVSALRLGIIFFDIIFFCIEFCQLSLIHSFGEFMDERMKLAFV